MERPEIIGWELTTNENGIVMSTLPQSKMVEIIEYLKYAENELKKLRVADVIKNEVAVCGCKYPVRVAGDRLLEPYCGKCFKDFKQTVL